MKKINVKGFTLIELLAVITIMGILMIVAIPSVTRTIENSRKDTFFDTVKQYANGVKNMWISDNLSCETKDGEFTSSSVPVGLYYVEVDSSSDSVPQVLESGGKSPWGNRDIKGFVYIIVWLEPVPGSDGVINGALKCDATGVPGTNGTTACVSTDDYITRHTTFHPVLVDGIHGINVDTSDNSLSSQVLPVHSLKKGDIVMSGAVYSIVIDEETNQFKVLNLKSDINGDGNYTQITDGINELDVQSYKCVEQ